MTYTDSEVASHLLAKYKTLQDILRNVNLKGCIHMLLISVNVFQHRDFAHIDLDLWFIVNLRP